MRLYSFLLHLYPASFRIEYETELRQVFLQRRRNVSGLSVVFFWISEFFDILWNAAMAHLDILRQDLRFTFRSLSRKPGFAFTAIVVTALGIGANTAVFSIVDQVLIRKFPYADSERIVRLWHRSPDYPRFEVSPANYRDWKRATSFEGMGCYASISLNFVGNGNPQRLDGAAVSYDLLPLLGINPVVGRLFRPEEDRDGASGTMLISYGMWQSTFGGDPSILGKKATLDDEVFDIIGVMPQGFYFPTREIQYWIPDRFGDSAYEERDNTYLKVIGKLKSGVTIDQARSEMGIITGQLEKEYPKENAHIGCTVETLRDGVPDQSRMLLKVLFGASACVLLIACTNLANLFLVRAMGRAKELTVRAALGAGRERLVRQLLTESLLLAFLGGICGLVLAQMSLPLLERLIPVTLPVGKVTAMNGRIFAFAALLVSVTGIGFGVIPALRICGSADASGLREGSRMGIGGRRERVRSVLVIAEVTASVILLISSGLLIRALWKIQSTDPGFRAESVLTAQTPLPIPRYNSEVLRKQFYRRVLTETRALPGVTDAAYISFIPMGAFRGGIWDVQIPGLSTPESGEAPHVSLRFATPQVFSALKIPLQLGRDISESDSENSQFTAVVSQSFAHKFWPNESPIGRTFTVAFHERTIVGVVGDIRARGLERASEPQVYLPYQQQVPDGSLVYYNPKAIVIRSSINAEALAKSVREIVRNADPDIPLSDVKTLQEVVTADTASRRTQISVICAFAGLSLLLAGIGIHGLLAFAVSQRTPEIGLRIALGAQGNDILGMVMRNGLSVAAIGGVIGIILAYVAGRFMQALLAGITPYDPLAFLSATGLAILTTLSGCLLPAFRAVRVDPATVMHVE